MEMLYKKHNYLDKNINFLCSQEIYEYDLKSAGFNILKYFKLVDDVRIHDLELSSKKQRQIKIGLLTRNDKELMKALNEGFENARKLFFEANNIKNEDILAIKKDAIFTLKPCVNVEFDNLFFDIKNYYSSYFYINKMEFYYNSKRGIDMKGIGDKQQLHKEYMLDFIAYFAKLMETSKREIVIKFLKEFIRYYKNKNLDIGYYRELNTLSAYKSTITMLDETLYFNQALDYEQLDISYNYLNYIIPIMQLLI